MVTALVVTALAVLLWPSGAARRRARRVVRRPRPGRPGVRGAWSPHLVVGGTVALAVALGAALSTPLVAGLGGSLSGLAASAWLRSRRAARDGERLLALARGVAALAADLRSGRPVASATTAAAAACGDRETGEELARAVRAPGVPGPVALGRPGGPLARISGAVVLSSRTGCSLAAVLGAIEDDLRARHRQDQELRAAVAGPRAGAVLLAGLPLLALAMGSGVGADPWGVLTTTGTGQVLLVGGVALELVGVAWTARLVRRALR